MVEKIAWLRNQECKKVLEDTVSLIVGHKPHASSWEERSRGRVENRSVRFRLVRNAIVSDSNQGVAYRTPARLYLRVGIQHDSHNVALFARLELNRNGTKEPLDVLVRPHLI